MTFTLGAKSLGELRGVRPDLVKVVGRAIQITEQDFSVHDGLRTIEEQREYVKRGVSKTMNSMHMKQADGFGYAVDLVPYVNGKLRWEWEPIYHIAAAVRAAAEELAVNIVWGGVWDRNLNDLPMGPMNLKQAVATYCKRHPGPDFIDGPHFQLGKA